MDEKKKEHWLQLCELAANEQDPAKLLDLVKEINCLLQEKEEQLYYKRNGSRVDVSKEKNQTSGGPASSSGVDNPGSSSSSI